MRAHNEAGVKAPFPNDVRADINLIHLSSYVKNSVLPAQIGICEENCYENKAFKNKNHSNILSCIFCGMDITGCMCGFIGDECVSVMGGRLFSFMPCGGPCLHCS